MKAELPKLDLVVFDQEESCPYLSGRVARLPLVMPRGGLTPEQLDRRLAAGHRRSGEFLYSVACPRCRECEPLRLDVNEFRMSRSQRRVWKRGNSALRMETSPIQIDEARVALFNLHRRTRGLEHGPAIDLDDYRSGFANSCCDSFEMSFLIGRQLAGVAICDIGRESLSAVYTYYDPAWARFSPGVFSILSQIDFCRRRSLRYLYLGFYIGQSPHMSYKRQYNPHQRLIDNQWQRFDRPDR